MRVQAFKLCGILYLMLCWAHYAIAQTESVFSNAPIQQAMASVMTWILGLLHNVLISCPRCSSCGSEFAGLVPDTEFCEA